MALISVGETAPAFSLPNQDGGSVSLSDHAGKYVLIWWYPKAGTPGWTIEGNGFRDRAQDFENQNAVILGASFDAPETNKAFKDNFDYPYDLLSDADGAMSRAYGVAEADSPVAPRKSVLVAPDGTIAARYDEVVPAEHPDQVLGDLKGLG